MTTRRDARASSGLPLGPGAVLFMALCCALPLLIAGGKPLIEWHIEKLAAIGIREIVVNTSWLAEQFPRALGDGDASVHAHARGDDEEDDGHRDRPIVPAL